MSSLDNKSIAIGAAFGAALGVTAGLLLSRRGNRSSSSKKQQSSSGGGRPKLRIHGHVQPENRAPPAIVDHEQWLSARRALLSEEKELTRHLDEVAKARMSLPWEKVTKDYVFQGPDGDVKLSELFGAHKPDLIVYHLMYDPSWDSGCKVCCYWLDGINGYYPHLHARANVVVISKAPYEKMAQMAKKKGWEIPMLSSAKNTFNQDLAVEPTAADEAAKSNQFYNYGTGWALPVTQYPGISIFRRGKGQHSGSDVTAGGKEAAEKQEDDRTVYHTYSAYSRGLDVVNGSNQLMDFLPHGRDGFHPEHREAY